MSCPSIPWDQWQYRFQHPEDCAEATFRMLMYGEVRFEIIPDQVRVRFVDPPPAKGERIEQPPLIG